MATLEQKRRPLARSGWQNELWLIPVQVGILVALLVLWQVSVSQKNLMFFSRPTLVAERLYELFVGGEIYRHILVTMQEVLIGYALGAFLGLTLGFILGRSNILSKVFQPFIIGLYSIPKIALAPLFIVWFGLGIESKVAVVLLATFFLVFFNTYSGLLNVNEELVQLARLMKASWAQTVGRVILPASAGQIFIGLEDRRPLCGDRCGDRRIHRRGSGPRVFRAVFVADVRCAEHVRRNRRSCRARIRRERRSWRYRETCHGVAQRFRNHAPALSFLKSEWSD